MAADPTTSTTAPPVSEVRDGDVRIVQRGGAGAADIEALSARERRRRIRRARRDGRRLFRGRLVPRSLRAAAALALAMGLAAGAATATTYAVMDARVARAEKEGRPASEPTTGAGATVEAGAPSERSISEIVLEANATGGDPTLEGLGVAVTSDDERTYWLTAYAVVEASTVTPPSPITLRDAEGTVEAWTWDPDTQLGLVATTGVEGTARTWTPPELTLTPGSLLAVVLPSPDGPPLPVTVAVDEPLNGPRDDFAVRADGVVLPLGAAVTVADGRLVGVITAAEYPDGGTVATVTAIRAACIEVLDCTDVGG